MDPVNLGLPHREPFVFIESVAAHEPGVMAVATKTFSGQEPFFQGHFPGNPVVPGVLLAEGMAQTAGVAVGDPDHVFLLTAIQSMKFLRPVRPKEPIVFTARTAGAFQTLFMCDVKAEVAHEVVAEGRVVLTRGPHAQEQMET